MTRWLAVILVFFMASLFWAEPGKSDERFEARVVRVKDGDSVVVERLNSKRVSEIRLAGIDAPELSQPWGVESKKALMEMLKGGQVQVEVTDRDRYHRLVAKLWVDDLYINAEMTRTGNAWAFARYLPDKNIRAGHDAARKKGLGLWSLPEEDRVPPPTWRMMHPRGG